MIQVNHKKATDRLAFPQSGRGILLRLKRRRLGPSEAALFTPRGKTYDYV